MKSKHVHFHQLLTGLKTFAHSNDAVRDYNTRTSQVSNDAIAALLEFAGWEYFKADEAVQGVPTVEVWPQLVMGGYRERA